MDVVLRCLNKCTFIGSVFGEHLAESFGECLHVFHELWFPLSFLSAGVNIAFRLIFQYTIYHLIFLAYDFRVAIKKLHIRLPLNMLYRPICRCRGRLIFRINVKGGALGFAHDCHCFVDTLGCVLAGLVFPISLYILLNPQHFALRSITTALNRGHQRWRRKSMCTCGVAVIIRNAISTLCVWLVLFDGGSLLSFKESNCCSCIYFIMDFTEATYGFEFVTCCASHLLMKEFVI